MKMRGPAEFRESGPVDPDSMPEVIEYTPIVRPEEPDMDFLRNAFDEIPEVSFVEFLSTTVQVDGHITLRGKRIDLTDELCSSFMGSQFLRQVVNRERITFTELKIFDPHSRLNEEEVQKIIRGNPNIRSLEFIGCLWLTGKCLRHLQQNSLEKLEVLSCDFFELSPQTVLRFTSSLTHLKVQNVRSTRGIHELVNIRRR